MFDTGVMVRNVRWAGVQFDAIVELNGAEVERRASVGLGAITDFGTLDLLSSLPAGARVPWSDVDPVAAAYLDCLPSGVVSTDNDAVERVMTYPLHIAAIVKVVRSWRAAGALYPLSRWAPVVAVSRFRPASPAQARQAANKSGIGLVYVDRESPSGATQLARPRTPGQVNTARSRLTEIVFDRWLRQNTEIPAARNHAFSCLGAGCGKPV